jgi:radical SAM-linked protein
MEKKLRFRFSKTGMLKYLSHLDMINMIIRAMRRAGIKVKYSAGFNPRPVITFGPPIPLGAESEAEYADVTLTENISPDDFVSVMNLKLEQKIIISGARDIPAGVKSLMSQADIAEYEICLAGDRTGGRLRELADRVMRDPGMKDSVYQASAGGEKGQEEDRIIICGYTKTAKGRNDRVFKLRDLLEALDRALSGTDISIERVLRKQLFILKDGQKLTPFEVLRFYV